MPATGPPGQAEAAFVSTWFPKDKDANGKVADKNDKSCVRIVMVLIKQSPHMGEMSALGKASARSKGLWKLMHHWNHRSVAD